MHITPGHVSMPYDTYVPAETKTVISVMSYDDWVALATCVLPLLCLIGAVIVLLFRCCGLCMPAAGFDLPPAATLKDKYAKIFNKSAPEVQAIPSKKRASVQLGEHKAIPLLVALDEPLVAALRSTAVKFIDANRIRDGTIGKVMRRQDLERLERERGVQFFLSPERSIEVHRSNARAVASLTYCWDTPDGDDPSGEYLSAVLRYLQSDLGSHVEAVFWDCPCLPQVPRTGSEDKLFVEALDVMALTYASVFSTTVIRHRRVPARPKSLDGDVVVYGEAVAEQDVRTGLGKYGEIESVSRDDKGRWRAHFKSHADAERASAAGLSIVKGAKRLQTFHVPRPYEARGWTCCETGVATEGVSRGAYYTGLKPILDRLPPKLVEIDGAAPEAAREQYGGSEGMGPRIERVRSSIRSAFFSSEGDRGTVVRLFNDYITKINNAMVYSGEGVAGEYVGEKNAAAQYEGRGKYMFADGDVYEGEWKAGKKEGRGIYLYANGDVYKGEYKADKKEGPGILRWADGNVYEGEWRADEREGRGIYRWASGDVYDGEWKAGKKDGRGVNRWADGDVYEGEYKADKQEGRGAFRWASGDVYEGEWKAGNPKQEGCGIYRWVSGDVYEGEWKAGKRDGKGTYLFADGRIEVGFYRAGTRVGEGIIWTPDGRAAGQLQDGKAVKMVTLEEAERLVKHLGLPMPVHRKGKWKAGSP